MKRAPTVGRSAELTASTRFLDAIADGHAGMLLEGHAGIGKSALWRATVVAGGDRGYRVISTTAVEAEIDLPFVGLRDLLDPVADLAATLPAPQLEALEVALLRSDDLGAVADQHAVCVAALGVVRALAENGPVLLAVDDVDWLDKASERVLRYVVRRLSTERVGVLVARRTDGDREPPLGLDGPVFQRVALGPLTVDDLRNLLVEHHGFPLPQRTVRRIHELSSGNPFVAVELAAAAQKKDGRRTLADGVVPLPGGVLAVTAQRIAALSSGRAQRGGRYGDGHDTDDRHDRGADRRS